MNRHYRQILLLAAGLVLLLAPCTAAEVKHLTLPEAVRLALSQNRALKIARLRIVEGERKKDGARASYFPEIKSHASFFHTTSEQKIDIPAGASGILPSAGPVPTHDVVIKQGHESLVVAGTTATQPLTPLLRIRQANRIASSEVAASRHELKKAESEIAVGVHELYFGILIAQAQRQAAELESSYAGARLKESEEDVRNGSALKVAAMEGKAALLQSRQAVLAAKVRVADLTMELNEVLGLPLNTELELAAAPAGSDPGPREDYVRAAVSDNPGILAAQETVRQAQAAVTAAKSTYIPDVAIFARQSYQNGVPFLVHNFGSFGVNLGYDLFDFGKRRSEIREREAKLAQARENLQRLKDSISVQVDRYYNKAELARHMTEVAEEVVQVRAEGERLAKNQSEQGSVLESSKAQAAAAHLKAKADLLQAQLADLTARAELEQAAGRTPGQ
ncbi:MAG: TolC family protein [Paludibaculum sp.]